MGVSPEEEKEGYSGKDLQKVEEAVLGGAPHCDAAMCQISLTTYYNWSLFWVLAWIHRRTYSSGSVAK